jgi:dienelactone hydrolase
VPHEFHLYENAGHAFQSFNSEEHYRHDVSEDAWEKALEFLQRQLSN